MLLNFSFVLEIPIRKTESFSIECNRYLSITTGKSDRSISSLSQIDIEEDTATSLSTCSSSDKVSLLNEMQKTKYLSEFHLVVNWINNYIKRNL